MALKGPMSLLAFDSLRKYMSHDGIVEPVWQAVLGKRREKCCDCGIRKFDNIHADFSM